MCSRINDILTKCYHPIKQRNKIGIKLDFGQAREVDVWRAKFSLSNTYKIILFYFFTKLTPYKKMIVKYHRNKPDLELSIRLSWQKA